MTTAVPYELPVLCKPRRKTRQVKVRDILVGGDAPISVQTMVKVPTENYDDVMRRLNPPFQFMSKTCRSRNRIF